MENLDLLNPYVLLFFGAIVFLFVLAVFVLLRNPYSPINKFFSAFTFTVVLWALCETISSASLSSEVALLWLKIGALGGLLMGPMYLLFTLAFTKNYRWLNNFFTHICILGISFFLFIWVIFISPTNPQNLQFFDWGWEYISFTTPLRLSFIWSPFVMIIGLFLCWRFYKKTEDLREKKQALFIMTATIVPVILGVMSTSIMPELGIMHPVFPTLFALSSLALFGPLAYAALKYKLFGALTPSAVAETVIEAMKDALIVTNSYMTIEFVNGFFSQLLGYRKDELVNRGIENVVFQEKKNLDKFEKEILSKVKRGSDLTDVEIDLATKNKEKIPTVFSSSVIKDAKKVLGVVCIARDMRETKKLINELNKTAEELRETKYELERKIGEMIRE